MQDCIMPEHYAGALQAWYGSHNVYKKVSRIPRRCKKLNDNMTSGLTCRVRMSSSSQEANALTAVHAAGHAKKLIVHHSSSQACIRRVQRCRDLLGAHSTLSQPAHF